jgi:hypothetical protein
VFVTTSNPLISSVIEVLTDYELHHSGSPESAQSVRTPNKGSTSSTSNPGDWSTNHRAVPPYRHVNQNLDREQRLGGRNGVEADFIFTILNGVRIKAVGITGGWKVRGVNGLIDGQSGVGGYTGKAE